MTALDELESATGHAAAEPAALWQQIAQHPDDDAPRIVLGDVLLASGDPRGLLFALQLSRTRHRGRGAELRVERLIRRHGPAWFGDLAAILVREGNVFRRGMLEQIRVGHTTTPDEAWTKALGHRELGAVRSLARAHAPPVHYARLAASLPHLRSIDVDRLAFIDALEA